MASRESSMDEASRPLMSTADTGRQQSVRPTTPGFFTPPAGRYGEEEDQEKRWPLNVVLLRLFRMLIVVLALTATIHILNKRGPDSEPAMDNRNVGLCAVSLNQPCSGYLFPPHESTEHSPAPSIRPVQLLDGKTSFSVVKRDGGEGWEVALLIVGVIQILWNLLKLTPRCLWRKALLCLCGGHDHGNRPVDCTVGAYRIVLLRVGDDEDQAYDDAVEQLPPKPPRRFWEVVKKSLGDLLVTLCLLTCTVVYVATYDHYYTVYYASAMTGLYFTNV